MSSTKDVQAYVKRVKMVSVVTLMQEQILEMIVMQLIVTLETVMALAPALFIQMENKEIVLSVDIVMTMIRNAK